MGDEREADERKKLFSDYQVNEEILDHANSDVVFLHCLPAIRGQEISHNLLEDPRSLSGGKQKIDSMLKRVYWLSF